jgi:hypothetical protein
VLRRCSQDLVAAMDELKEAALADYKQHVHRCQQSTSGQEYSSAVVEKVKHLSARVGMYFTDSSCYDKHMGEKKAFSSELDLVGPGIQLKQKEIVSYHSGARERSGIPFIAHQGDVVVAVDDIPTQQASGIRAEEWEKVCEMRTASLGALVHIKVCILR